MMYIFIPYYEQAAVWEELRYAVRSWATFAKFNYQLVIVGDYPDWMQNAIHLKHEITHNGKEGELLRDAISKMQVFLKFMEGQKDKAFIRTYDDIFLLRPVNLQDIAIPKAVNDLTKLVPRMDNTYRKQLWSTYRAVRNNGGHGWNMESHTPEAFVSTFMQQVLKHFEVPPKELLSSTLYYNTMMQDSNLKPVVLTKEDRWKAGFYGFDDKYSFGQKEDVEKICSGKTFLNFDNAGFTTDIKTYLEQTFPNPCRHEI